MLLVGPLCLSWGLGTSQKWLDFLALPGAIFLSLPAEGGWPGLFVVTLLFFSATVWGRSRRRGAGPHRLSLLALSLAGLGLWSSLLPLLAAARPVSWIAGLAFLLSWVPGRRASRPHDGFALALGWLGWASAMHFRPFGRGILRGGFEEGVGEVIERLSPAFWEVLFAGLVLLFALGVARRRRLTAVKTLAEAGVGAGFALALELSFGLGLEALASALSLGALAWLLKPHPAQGLASWALRPASLYLVAGLCVLRLGIVERWDCRLALEDPLTSFWVDGPDVTSIAVVPGNLPYVLALRQDGSLLERLTARAVVSASVPLEPAGGRLVPPHGLPARPPRPTDLVVARVIDEDRLLAEWWNVATLERLYRQELDLPCVVGKAELETGSLRLWVPCQDRGELVLFDPVAGKDPVVEKIGRGLSRSLQTNEGILNEISGPMARVQLRDASGNSVGASGLWPYATGSTFAGPDLAVARGPAGQLEFRGFERRRPDDPDLESSIAGGPLRWKALLGRVRDRIRVGPWPGRPLWAEAQRSLYVSSPIDARIWLVDREVPWHKRSAHVGSPPRQVVVDSLSGSLYGVNRCGAFEVKIRSTFPWDDVGPPPSAAKRVLLDGGRP